MCADGAFRNSQPARGQHMDGQHLALCARGTILIVDRDGVELARGNGAHESLSACVFSDEATLHAAGRDVNCGPAIVTLSLNV